MKRTLLSTSVALAVAGFLGTGVALAQYNAPTTPPTPAATPAATPDASKSPAAKMAVVPSRTESGASAFAKLDMNHQGYLTIADVSQLQGFDFKTADKNNDGKLDATEFNAAWAIYAVAPKS